MNDSTQVAASRAITVPFHGADLYVVEHNGQPFTPMKPIVAGMGLDWAAQFSKLKSNPVRWGIAEIAIPTLSGVQTMICLPLRKLFGWLASINTGKIRAILRETVATYQNECDDVLWQYWNDGLAISPRATRPHNPAIDYTRISPAQAQDLKELVHSVVDAKVQGFAETWARLHKKFRVNSYLELPASRFEEARDYLLGKLPEAPQQPQAAPQPTAFTQALAAARENALSYMNGYRQAVQSGQPGPRMADIPGALLEGIVADALMNSRFLAGFDHRTGQMHVQLVPQDASVFSFQSGDFGHAISAIPTRRLPELQDALSRRVARHLGTLAH